MNTAPLILAACLLASAACPAAVIFSDSFTVGATPDSNDLNYNNAARQSGTAGAQTWTKTSGSSADTQVGNNETNIGQAGGAANVDYLLIAHTGGVANSLAFNSTLSGISPISVSFDIYANNNSDPTSWISFTLQGNPAHNGHPVVGSGDFGMLYRANGELQVFPGSGGVIPATPLTGHSFTLVFSNSAGTGSAFDGTGSMVTIYNEGNLIASYDVGQMTTEYMALRSEKSGTYGGIDNLVVQTVPEPSALLLGGLAALGFIRRRRD